MKIIYDLNELKGTCYIEVLPGRYKGKSWNKESIFFTEEDFIYFEPIIANVFIKYDHYAFQEIGKDNWTEIIESLKELQKTLLDNSNEMIVKLDELIRSYFKVSTIIYRKEYIENSNKLNELINKFNDWIRKTLENYDEISILGI
jgi:site-specific DNA-adenine methylase